MKGQFILHIIALATVIHAITLHQEIIPNHEPYPQDHEKKEQINNDEVWATIFIHGTLGIERLMNMETIITLLRRSIDGSRYQRLLTALREHPYSYSAQPAQLPGLRKINTTEEKTSAELFAHLYNIMQNQYFPNQKNLEWLTFGWSGAINHLQRVHDAGELFDALVEYIKVKKTQYPNLKIRLVSYSHGSNVALNLEHWRQKKEEMPFIIDELIMLGTPVIVETEDYIYSPLFKNIYSIYSRHDMASILDLFSTRGTFPRRRFHKKRGAEFPQHFKQIELELTLTAKNDIHKPNNSNRTIEKSPGHLEMWLFGWPDVTLLCRRHFPLAPLPAVLLVPAIVAYLQNNPNEEHDQILCYKTDEGYASLRKRFSTEKIYIDFVQPSIIASLQSYAWQFWNQRLCKTEKDAIQLRCNGILQGLLC